MRGMDRRGLDHLAETMTTDARRPRRRRWLWVYYGVLMFILLIAAAAAAFIWQSLSAETRSTLFNTYFNPDEAARL